MSEKKLIEHFLFFHILGMSSSQLTFIFFRGVPEVDFPRGTVGTVADATWLPGGKDCLRRQLSWADHGEGGFPFCSDEVLFFLWRIAICINLPLKNGPLGQKWQRRLSRNGIFLGLLNPFLVLNGPFLNRSILCGPFSLHGVARSILCDAPSLHYQLAAAHIMFSGVHKGVSCNQL